MISQVWAQSSDQLVIDPYDLPGKAEIWLFMVALLLYENAFSILLEFFLPVEQMETLAKSFYGIPCVFQSLYVLLQMRPHFPNDNFSFPLTALELHPLASKVFLSASFLHSVFSSRTLCCEVEENNRFLPLQHLSYTEKHHHKFDIYLSNPGDRDLVSLIK